MLLVALVACSQPESQQTNVGTASTIAHTTSASSTDSTLLPQFKLGDELLRPEEATLFALSARHGGTLWRHPTSASGDTRLCFVGQLDGRDVSLVFGSSSMGGEQDRLSFVVLDTEIRSVEKEVPCPRLALPFEVRVQAHGLSLGTTTQELEAALGTPERRVGDTLFFSWARQELGPYKTIGAQKDTTVAWDLYSYVTAIIDRGRVRALVVGHSTTY